MAMVQCTVDSEPPAELALTHNGTVLATSHGLHGSASGTSHIQVARNALRLQVPDKPAGDDDIYVCTAQNVLGSTRTTWQLRMEGEWERGREGGVGAVSQCLCEGLCLSLDNLKGHEIALPCKAKSLEGLPSLGGDVASP